MLPHKILILLTIFHFVQSEFVSKDEELRAEKFMNALLPRLTENYQKLAKFSWQYNSNVTHTNLHLRAEVENDFYKNLSDFQQEAFSFDFLNLRNNTLKNLFQKLIEKRIISNLDVAWNMIELQMQMMEIYGTTKICSFMNSTQCEISTDTNLFEIFEKHTSQSELLYSWLQFHDALSARFVPIFVKYVQFSNKVAKFQGLKNTFDEWLRPYQDGTDFMAELQSSILTKLQPFYLQLHAYVRFKLQQNYGSNIVLGNDSIPAHLLGHVSAVKWNHIIDIILPYQAIYDINYRALLSNKSGVDFYKDAEAFFVSLNMSWMPKSFWNKSVFEKPLNRKVLCQPVSLNFFTPGDVSILQCTKSTFEDLLTTYHEMGHIQYYLQYQLQPALFQSSPNSGLHEAIGNAIGLSIQSRKHMKRSELLRSDAKPTPESLINDMLRIAINTVVPIFTCTTAEFWRQGVFNGTIKPKDFNRMWWKYRIQFQGVKPPIPRGSEDFDAASTYRIASGTSLLMYIVRNLLQFQIHRGLCIKAHEYSPQFPDKLPLHDCDIYGSTEAGQALKDALKLGSSKSGSIVLEILTGEKQISSEPIVEYFKPLHDWLIKYNYENKVPIGWEQLADQISVLKDPLYDENYASTYLIMVTDRIREYNRLLAQDQWERVINKSISYENNDLEKLRNELIDLRTHAQKFFYYNFRNISLKDQYVKFTEQGPFRSNRGKIQDLQRSIMILKTVYDTTDVQPFVDKLDERNLSIFVNLNEVYSSSQNQVELFYLWTKFRNEIGPKIKVPFFRYVHLSNMVAHTKGYQNTIDQWTQEQGMSLEHMADIIHEIHLFYKELHAFVRFNLGRIFKNYNVVEEDGSIQSYLLDNNMSSMRWDRILQKVVKIQYRQIKNFSVEELYKKADDFFQSLGLPKMPHSFWKNSVFNSTTSNCKSFVWNSFNGDDIRIFKCNASVDLDFLLEVYQDMAELVAMLKTQHFSTLLRNSPNLGILKAIRNAVGLAVNNQFYLRQQFFIFFDNDHEIQKLLKVALETVPVLMNIYVMEQWRSDVFRGLIPMAKVNERWWKLQYEYLGVIPIRPLDNLQGFDPGASYEIISGTEMISSFVGIVLGFKIHAALYEQDLKDSVPLRNFAHHDCDIYNSKEAGNILKASMEAIFTYSTNEFVDLFEYTTGVERLNAKALLQYFAPLRHWLKNFHMETNTTIGWKVLKDKSAENDKESLSIFQRFTERVKNFLRTALAIFNLFFWR